jgi:hypothetical protein
MGMAPAMAALIAGALGTSLFADPQSQNSKANCNARAASKNSEATQQRDYIFKDMKVTFVKGKVSDVE